MAWRGVWGVRISIEADFRKTQLLILATVLPLLLLHLLVVVAISDVQGLAPVLL